MCFKDWWPMARQIALSRIARVTAQNGRLAIVEFKKQVSHYGPPLSIRLSSEDVQALVRGYGFSKESIQEVGQYHYVIVFRKR
jgi:ubiquinone/menaquinone biosynthesis C-methylase UbiE